MRIAIVVHGRFVAFDMASALLEAGHDVRLFTNYPRWAVERFGFPGKRVKSFWPHALITRSAAKIGGPLADKQERWFNPMFGKWALQEIAAEPWDVVNCWSGVGEEIFSDERVTGLKVLIRGSSHIRYQSRLLSEESQRAGVSIEQPNDWIISREEREYDLSDVIVAISTFAHNSFIAEGVQAEKMRLLTLPSTVSEFLPSAGVLSKRIDRVLSNPQLRVLSVGTLSHRKGLLDLAEIIRLMEPEISSRLITFRLVGPVAKDAEPLISSLRDRVEVAGKVEQSELPRMYEWGDLFILPTIEDGFAIVLSQAVASGLPIMTTTNSGGPDLISTDGNGWVLPIRSPQLFAERLRWCLRNRAHVASMVESNSKLITRTWTDVAADFESFCGVKPL